LIGKKENKDRINMIEKLFEKSLANPIEIAVAIGIILVCLGIFFKLAGNPFSVFINLILSLAPYALKEFRGDAGRTGKFNLIITSFLFLITILLILKPSMIAYIGVDSDYSNMCWFYLALLATTAMVFLISLKMVRDTETFKKLIPHKRLK
jgi:hypothetical protein